MYGIKVFDENASLPHLQLKLELWHDWHKQQWVDGKQLLYEVEHMLRQITYRRFTHHQHLVKELTDTTGCRVNETSGNEKGATKERNNECDKTLTEAMHVSMVCTVLFSNILAKSYACLFRFYRRERDTIITRFSIHIY